MSDFQIWANVQYIGPQFLVVVSAVPERPAKVNPVVHTRLVSTQAEVPGARAELIALTEAVLGDRGDRVLLIHLD